MYTKYIDCYTDSFIKSAHNEHIFWQDWVKYRIESFLNKEPGS